MIAGWSGRRTTREAGRRTTYAPPPQPPRQTGKGGLYADEQRDLDRLRADVEAEESRAIEAERQAAEIAGCTDLALARRRAEDVLHALGAASKARQRRDMAASLLEQRAEALALLIANRVGPAL